MAKYRKISTRIWNDDKFSILSCDAKLLFFFLLSHPHMTPLGAMRANSPGIAHELSWSLERLSEAFREVSVKGMVRVDERASCVFLPNFVKHNLPESPNVILAWEKCLDDIPDCSLKNKAIHTAREVSLTMSEAFQKACGRLPEVFRKGMPNQEQEPEPEPEPEQEPLKAFCAEPQKDEVQTPSKSECSDSLGIGDEKPQDEKLKPKPRTKASLDLEVLPQVLRKDVILAFVESRKALRKPLTQRALLMCCKDAMRCQELHGIDPNDAMERAIGKGWMTCDPEYFSSQKKPGKPSTGSDKHGGFSEKDYGTGGLI